MTKGKEVIIASKRKYYFTSFLIRLGKGELILSKKKDFLNEEEVKQKIVLPLLREMGFNSDELEFEKLLSIRLGRKEKNIPKIEGRLDILCKRENRNLFIIEVKSEKKSIDQNDIEQGVSYARLVDPIAPFVIVTNGKKTKVIDAINKEEIKENNFFWESKFFRNNFEISIEDEFNFRFEALKNFIGYSQKNLSVFSEAQIEGKIASLKGDKNDLTKKYVPELFLKKKELTVTFQKFLESSKSIFSIIGPSGVGKTNFMCNLAEENISDNIVLFYNGANIFSTILEKIKDDFNWFFSPDLEPDGIFQRLSEIGKSNSKKVIVFIDAIDEIPIKDKKGELINFCEKVTKFNNLKICISCKESEWEQFLKIRDIDSVISTSTFSLDNKKGYFLSGFSKKELGLIFERYKKQFFLKGDLKGELRNFCKNGFNLRLVAEVYSGEELPEGVEDIDLLKSYLEKKIQKMDDQTQEISFELLEEIGKLMVEGDDQQSVALGKVSKKKLKEVLGISKIENIPSDLFSFNLLTLTNNEVGFYFDQLKDFVIAIVSYKLDKAEDETFKKKVQKLLKSKTGRGALKWYISFLDSEKEKIILEVKKDEAENLANEYEDLIDKNFPKLKTKFEPKGKGKIGIVIPFYKTPFIEGFGFRCITSDKEKVTMVKEGKFFETGVSHVTSSSYDLFTKETANNFIKRQLKHLVEKGNLTEKDNLVLLKEKVLAIIYSYEKELGLSKRKERLLPRYNDILPIDLNEIIREIELAIAKKFIEYKLLKEKEKSGEIKEEKKGEFTSVSLNNWVYDQEEVEKKALELLKNGEKIPYKILNEPFNLLPIYIKQLLEVGIDRIEEPLLPAPDIPIEELFNRIEKLNLDKTKTDDVLVSQYSYTQLERYIKRFFELFLQGYNKLVETNFPSSRNHFRLYKLQPIHLQVFFNPFSSDWSLIYGYQEIRSEHNIIEVEDLSQIGKKDKMIKEQYYNAYTTLDKLFFSFNNRFLGIPKANKFTILREWIYREIEGEIRNISRKKESPFFWDRTY